MRPHPRRVLPWPPDGLLNVRVARLLPNDCQGKWFRERGGLLYLDFLSYFRHVCRIADMCVRQRRSRWSGEHHIGDNRSVRLDKVLTPFMRLIIENGT